MIRKIHGLVVVAIAAPAIASFLTVWVLAVIYGGDAASGFERAGHFYIWNRPHTGYQEVSQAIWQLSLLANRALPILWPLMFLAMGSWLVATESRVLNGTALREADSRVRFVRHSGVLLLSRRLSGSSGRVSVWGPLFLVEVYPAGVLVKPWLVRRHAILASEIRDVVGGRERGHDYLDIHHSGAGMPSPVRLWESPGAPLGAAIRTIAQGPDALQHPILPTQQPARGPRLGFAISISGEDDPTSSNRGEP
jgi:hypothetical protein